MVQKKYSDATRDKQIGNALRSLFLLSITFRCTIRNKLNISCLMYV